MENNKKHSAAYLLLRIAMGINLLGHGMVRIPKLQAFSDAMVAMMSKGSLPVALVKPWMMVLPFIEFGIGLLLIIGLFTHRALLAGATLIIILLFGCSTIENWEAMGIQMIYAIFFYILLMREADNYYAIDRKFLSK